MQRLPNDAARRLFLHRHLLAEAPTGPGKGADLNDLITRLGFVQLDSVRTVERAHHMILFARRPAYRPRHLGPLMERDRLLFEHWTHDAALIPMEFYPHWRLRFARDRARLESRWERQRPQGFSEQVARVMQQVREAGPCASSDVGEGEARSKGGWWEWHPSKTALDYLWRAGDLGVCHREAFRKNYDLTERVIPAKARAVVPSKAESIDWLCCAALKRLGFATSGELAAFWATVTPAEAKAWVDAALARGAVEPVEVMGTDGKPRRSVAFPGVSEAAQTAPEPTKRLRVLSPFDPALRDRNRAERLFGFHYRIEIFVPAAQRRYGYYVFPLLEGARIAGRIDMAADRAAGALVVTALWPERGVRWGEGRQTRLEAELARVARFAGLDEVRWQDGWLRQACP